jgi:hypothetical protein
VRSLLLKTRASETSTRFSLSWHRYLRGTCDLESAAFCFSPRTCSRGRTTWPGERVRMSVALRSFAPLRKRSFLALGALTFTLGLTARWRTLSLTPHAFRLRTGPLAQPFTVSSVMMASNLAPPQPPLRWNHAPGELLQLTKDAIQRDRAVSCIELGLEAVSLNVNLRSTTGSLLFRRIKGTSHPYVRAI